MMKKLGFIQAEYRYICERADKGFQYDQADEEKSVEGEVYWMLKNPEGMFLAYVHKTNGSVHEILHSVVSPDARN
tara:strand:- start:220 stop:444 length:225 start_codon:yes stop_codon:yes gene_type:complete